jgi:hypothetical protein
MRWTIGVRFPTGGINFQVSFTFCGERRAPYGPVHVCLYVAFFATMGQQEVPLLEPFLAQQLDPRVPTVQQWPETQQWPGITVMQQWPSMQQLHRVALVQQRSTWCSVKNTFGMSVYSKERVRLFDLAVLATASRPATGSTQPPIQWIPELFPRL